MGTPSAAVRSWERGMKTGDDGLFCAAVWLCSVYDAKTQFFEQ